MRSFCGRTLLIPALFVAGAQDCAEHTGGPEGAIETGCGCSAGTLSRDGSLPQQTSTSVGSASAEHEDAELAPRLVWVPSGTFLMGHNNRSLSPSTFDVDGEGPSRRVQVSGFWIGETEVSNRHWAAFAARTGYISESERYGWSFVFDKQLSPEINAISTESVQAAPW